MKLKRLLTLSVLATLSLLGITGIVRASQTYFTQRQSLNQAPILRSELEASTKIASTDELKNRQKQIQDTITTLEAIPNLPGFDYGKAQSELEKLRLTRTAVTQQLQIETQSEESLQAALKLDAEASSLIQKPPLPAQVWQQAKDKWEQAIALLEKIPPNTSVSGKAREGLTSTRTNYKNVSQSFTEEKRAVEKIEAALTTADQAMKLSQQSSYKLEDLNNARTQWYKAVHLLMEVPQSTTIAADARNFLEFFQRNFESVDMALNQFRTCLAQNTQPKEMCSYQSSVNVQMPPVENISDQTGTDTSIETTDTSNLSSQIVSTPYRSRYSTSSGTGSTWVSPYTRSDGTHVSGHQRSSGSRSSGFGNSRSGGASS